jgi:hypothetical protein
MNLRHWIFTHKKSTLLGGIAILSAVVALLVHFRQPKAASSVPVVNASITNYSTYSLVSGSCEANGLIVPTSAQCALLEASVCSGIRCTPHERASWAPVGCSFERGTSEYYIDGTGEEGGVCGSKSGISFECVCGRPNCVCTGLDDCGCDYFADEDDRVTVVNCPLQNRTAPIPQLPEMLCLGEQKIKAVNEDAFKDVKGGTVVDIGNNLLEGLPAGIIDNIPGELNAYGNPCQGVSEDNTRCTACVHAGGQSYYLENNRCEVCPADVAVQTALAFLVLILCFWIVWKICKSGPLLMTVASMAFSNLQIMAMFVDISLQWPPIITEIFQLVQSLVFLDVVQVARPDCAMELNFYKRWAASVLCPIVALAFLHLFKEVCLYTPCLSAEKKAEFTDRYYCVRNFILLMSYPRIAASVFYTLYAESLSEWQVPLLSLTLAFAACSPVGQHFLAQVQQSALWTEAAPGVQKAAHTISRCATLTTAVCSLLLALGPLIQFTANFCRSKIDCESGCECDDRCMHTYEYRSSDYQLLSDTYPRDTCLPAHKYNLYMFQCILLFLVVACAMVGVFCKKSFARLHHCVWIVAKYSFAAIYMCTSIFLVSVKGSELYALVMLIPPLSVYIIVGVPVWLCHALLEGGQQKQLYKPESTINKSLGWTYLKYNTANVAFEVYYLLEKIVAVAGKTFLAKQRLLQAFFLFF